MEAFGVALLSAETIARFSAERRSEVDLVLGMPTSRGLGFFLNLMEGPLGRGMGPTPTAYGHSGAGGKQGFADPERDVSVGFVRNHLTLGPFFGPKLGSASTIVSPTCPDVRKCHVDVSDPVDCVVA